MLRLVCLSLFAFAASSCVGTKIVVPNTEACTVAGTVGAGAICAETLSDKTRDMTMDEFFDFLEPRLETPELPARAGAICQSTDDWNSQKTALEQACRALKKNCSYELKQLIRRMTEIGQGVR